MTPSAGSNLALNKPATGSASCNARETPAKAVNGSVSGGTSDKRYSLAATRQLHVDLDAGRSITGFVVRRSGAGGEPSSRDNRGYDIEVSNDATAWTMSSRPAPTHPM